ncbi:hypothetical protein CLAIMM_12050 [Cladophialophora immunda]|nr:hypothetical protein CLAIMM_12050 [Cladophialophora immunda]
MVDLQEAINSMFDWYKKSAMHYVYLSDVSTTSPARDVGESNIGPHWREAFGLSQWFTRSWTLQKLIASVSVQFFSVEGSLIGKKESLEQLISDITGIDKQALRGRALSDFDVDTPLAWAANRVTKRPEDQAYSLVGIFGVRMTLHYGKGQEYTFASLQRKIIKLRKITKEADASVILSEAPENMGLRLRLKGNNRTGGDIVSCEKDDVEHRSDDTSSPERQNWSGVEVLLRYLLTQIALYTSPFHATSRILSPLRSKWTSHADSRWSDCV